MTNKIKERRKELNLSQRQLADLLNVSYQQIQKWEKSERIPTAINAITLARALDSSVENLFPSNKSKVIALKQRRQELKLTQKQVAERANIAESTYQRYERGQIVPLAFTAVHLAKALETTVEELYIDEE